MKSGKYSLEAILNVYVKNATIIRPNDIYAMMPEDLDKYNIYSVVSVPRPKITSIGRTKNDDLCFDIKYGTETLKNALPNIIESIGKEPLLDYDENQIRIKVEKENIKDINLSQCCGAEIINNGFTIKKEKIDEKDNNCVILTHSIDYLLFGHYMLREELLNLDLLYIGQSKKMHARLSCHKTIQKIQADYIKNNPDKIILIILFEIEPLKILEINGCFKKGLVTDKQDSEHFSNILCDALGFTLDEQIINATEALLIHHLKPIYNELLKNNFPDKKNKGYKQYFDLNYYGITFEFIHGFPSFIEDKILYVKMITETNYLTNNFKDKFRISYKFQDDETRVSMSDAFMSY